jgi:peroxiredoxin
VVAVSVDPREKSAQLAVEEKLSFPILADVSLSTIRAWGVADEQNGIAWPAVYIVGRDGKILWRSLAESFRKRPLSAELLTALDASR